MTRCRIHPQTEHPPADKLEVVAKHPSTIVSEQLERFGLVRGVRQITRDDGCIRDGAEIAAGEVPVFARGYAHPGPYKDGPGEIRGPIAFGGTVVRNGDIVVGDADGVAVVPVERLDEVIEGGLDSLSREGTAIAQAESGQMDTSWVDDRLNIIYVDGAEASSGRAADDAGSSDEVAYPKL